MLEAFARFARKQVAAAYHDQLDALLLDRLLDAVKYADSNKGSRKEYIRVWLRQALAGFIKDVGWQQAHFVQLPDDLAYSVDFDTPPDMRAALASLDDRARQVVELRVGDGATFNSVAALLGMKVKTAERVFHSAVSKMAKVLSCAT